jgi:AAA domain-containing protein
MSGSMFENPITGIADTNGHDPYADVPPPERPPDDDWHSEDDEVRDVRANAVRVRAEQIRLERDARALVDAEALPPVIYPPVTPLNALLDEPDESVCYRIDLVAPKQGNIILAAQYKAGKTIMVGNVIRSLADRDPFLGKFTVHQPAEHLVLIDNELGRSTVRRWLRDQNIRNTHAVADVITLRGRVSTFNILDDKIRDHWATRLRDLGCDSSCSTACGPASTPSASTKTATWVSSSSPSTRY